MTERQTCGDPGARGTALRRARNLRVLGSLAVAALAMAVHPARAAAQAIGTMQVVATVAAADASWAGLLAAQELAHVVQGGAPPHPLRLRRSLASIEAHRSRGSGGDSHGERISVQYLFN